jgi:hypothetical protein
MPALHVALHTLRTKHSVVEGKFLPRLEPDHVVAANLELNAALLAAEAAMRFHQAFRRVA